MPCADFAEVLFDRLTLRYGDAFLARWKGVPLQDVKAHWACELNRYADQREAIEHALALLDPAEPPTAAQFRDLCGTAPGSVFQAEAEPEPKQAHRATEVRRQCLRPVMPRIGRDVRWAAEIVKRAQAGERVPKYSLWLALDALGLPGPLR